MKINNGCLFVLLVVFNAALSFFGFLLLFLCNNNQSPSLSKIENRKRAEAGGFGYRKVGMELIIQCCYPLVMFSDHIITFFFLSGLW